MILFELVSASEKLGRNLIEFGSDVTCTPLRFHYNLTRVYQAINFLMLAYARIFRRLS